MAEPRAARWRSSEATSMAWASLVGAVDVVNHEKRFFWGVHSENNKSYTVSSQMLHVYSFQCGNQGPLDEGCFLWNVHVHFDLPMRHQPWRISTNLAKKIGSVSGPDLPRPTQEVGGSPAQRTVSSAWRPVKQY